MAKRVTNVFVDVTLAGEAECIAQHQKHFPGNVIARWSILGVTYVKVPYQGAETLRAGMTREQFDLIRLDRAVPI